jgi:5'-methylthioadenosine phosphorylase
LSAGLRTIIAQEAADLGYTVHSGGVYVNMDGPAFSTRAESEFHRKMGFDVIGMTSVPEAKLAREAEISLASMCFVTDYDCWKSEDEPVSAQTILGHLLANADAARKILPKVIEKIPLEPMWPEHNSLDFAFVTDRKLWPEATVRNLEIILKRFL